MKKTYSIPYIKKLAKYPRNRIDKIKQIHLTYLVKRPSAQNKIENFQTQTSQPGTSSGGFKKLRKWKRPLGLQYSAESCKYPFISLDRKK